MPVFLEDDGFTNLATYWARQGNEEGRWQSVRRVGSCGCTGELTPIKKGMTLLFQGYVQDHASRQRPSQPTDGCFFIVLYSVDPCSVSK